MEKGRSAFKILTGKPTGKKPLGRPRRKWEDYILDIRMDLPVGGIELIRLRIEIIGESPCDPPGSMIIGVIYI